MNLGDLARSIWAARMEIIDGFVIKTALKDGMDLDTTERVEYDAYGRASMSGDVPLNRFGVQDRSGDARPDGKGHV